MLPLQFYKSSESFGKHLTHNKYFLLHKKRDERSFLSTKLLELVNKTNENKKKPLQTCYKNELLWIK